MNFSAIRFSSIKKEIEDFLTSEYNKAGILYSDASPYGQILSIIENLQQLSFLYLKNAINQFDISLPNSQNERIIRNAAIFAGHIPGRSISATGTLKFTLKPSVDLEKEIPGSRISFYNKLSIKNKSNGLNYSLSLGNEKITHKITQNYQFFTSIIQGVWKRKSYTGAGLGLQSFQLTEIGQKDIENFNVEITVNGEMWTIKRHMWDMIPDEKSVVARTGFNGSVDIIFGTGAFGMIPPLGSIINVAYLVSDGSLGNIFRRTQNDWTFIDDVIDGNGQTLDITKVFDISIYTDINFGADKEDLQFTKAILPIVTNNAVMALPQHYTYEIKKLGVFSHVNAYEASGTIFISVTPNVNLFKNQSSNYFSIDKGAFLLDNYEKSKIDKYLRSSGTIQLTKKYKIVSPIISYYAINVFVIPYSDATDESVNAQILESISTYFLNLTRVDRIPKLDIIKVLSFIKDIHSVDIQFVSKKNEDYHKENIQNLQNQVNKYATTNVVNAPVNYTPTNVLGLDATLGDIIFEPNELPIIRGGWSDRNSLYYSDDIDSNGLKSVNIIKKGMVDVKNKKGA
jgi:hypothetical protein